MSCADRDTTQTKLWGWKRTGINLWKDSGRSTAGLAADSLHESEWRRQLAMLVGDKQELLFQQWLFKSACWHNAHSGWGCHINRAHAQACRQVTTFSASSPWATASWQRWWQSILSDNTPWTTCMFSNYINELKTTSGKEFFVIAGGADFWFIPLESSFWTLDKNLF